LGSMNAGRGKGSSAAARQDVAPARLITARLAAKAKTTLRRRSNLSSKPLSPVLAANSCEPG
jgi:hypothetical protein